MRKRINSLYIHIPFCSHICRYCDFTKLLYNDNFSNKYINALFYELDSYNISKMSTIYIGGGTPTSLNDELFELLLNKVSKYTNKNCEFTIEANVENLTKEKLLLMKKYGVNRLSIGIESTDDKILKSIGRNHTFDDAKKVVNLSKKIGFDNINIDLIFGFPNQSIEQLKIDLNNFIKLDIDHISIYSLIVDKGTMFFNSGVKEQNADEARIFYDEILSFLRTHGYERYEISNFARNKKYSKHNLTYWKDNYYIGVGLGASGYLFDKRYTNTKSLKKYLNHKFIDFSEHIDDKLHLEEFLLTNLRLEKGFKRKDFINNFKIDFVDMFKDKIAKLEKNNLIIINNDTIKLTDNGLIIMDYILRELL